MRRIIIGFITFFFVMLWSTGVVVAKEPATPELALQEAVERALGLSKTLKIADTQKDKAWEQRSESQDAVNYTPVGMVNPEIESAYATLLQSELNYQTKRKSYLKLQDDIKEEVVDKYYSVSSASVALDDAQKAFAQAEWEKRTSQLKLNEGTVAPVAMTAKNAAYEGAQGTLIEAQQNLNKAYVELNALVGFWPEDRPQLATDIEYTPIDVVSLNSEVNRAVNKSTDVWSALQKITIERQDLRMTLQPYEIEKMEVEIAELNANQAKDELEKEFLLLYHDIVSLEGGIKAAQENISAAKEALRVAQVQFDVGMAIKGDLLEKEADLIAVESKLAGLKNKHGSAMAAYRNLTGRDVLPSMFGEGKVEEL
ncbi:MAG: TolC family protein [Firmicutes bacterium]|nr:TolC family protein [Bacillota bacterium]